MSELAAVFQIGFLGDSIVSVPSLLSIKELLPDCPEYLLVSRFDSSLKVLPSHVFDMAWKPKKVTNYKGPSKGVKEAWSIASVLSQLRYYRPRYCIYLMPTARSHQQVERDKLFFRAGGVRELIGFRTLTPTELAPTGGTDVNKTEAFLKFTRIWNEESNQKFAKYSRPPVLQPSKESHAAVDRWLRKHAGEAPRLRIITICPFSNYPSKDIPDQTVANLIPRIERSAQAKVVLIGGKKDFERACALTAATGAGLNACGAFSLEESAALLLRSDVAVCADSGPMHLAGALGVPMVVAFSRINRDLGQWFPFGSNHTILYKQPPCAGCKSITCPIPGHPCMRDISPDEIVSNVMNKLRTAVGTVAPPISPTTITL